MMPKTPASQIPPEILAEILLLCAPSKYDHNAERLSSIIPERSSVIYPSQVCHYWRSTALSTPALWSFILFLCERNEVFAREAECAQVWLSRSAQCPISIEIVADDDDGDLVEEALQIFIPHCTRWKTMTAKTLCGDPEWWPVTGKLPLLESVTLSCAAGEAFAIAPRLRHLRLHIMEPLRFEPLKIPWSQLAHLELHIFDHDGVFQVHEILQQTSNIATLRIHTSGPANHQASTILSCPSLSTLEIHSPDQPSIKWFLDGLALPALRNLKLSQTWHSCITPFLARSACSLSSLDTHLREHNGFDILELAQLPLSNSLAYLRVSFSRVEDWETVVKSLMHRRGMPPFNNLRSLGMTCVFTPSRTNMECFADMVASRWNRVDADLHPESARCATLSHVELYVNHLDIYLHHVAISRLRTLAAEGLDIKVRTCNEELV
ncbi:hypothetical protein FIBSPDRAFT_257437 [Athelia psychrophila]|uniref:Uncharacterized protein n=1 Tax=Athelia psychrophila TaxID=1759441 RepID=A0A165XIR0_9AGAM|nr:hypothetical protein FIBSPDRAFT_257437 [Fibularhizoctonia sp. CBS 109695]